jgi:hypothetical protein
MAATTSYQIRSWTDEPDEGRTAEDWPYPTEHAEYRIDGDLADRVRARIGRSGVVTLIEDKISGGYSEYTIEDYFEFELRIDGEKVFEPNASRDYDENVVDVPRNVFVALNDWLTGDEQ